jgi:hypothetical protein
MARLIGADDLKRRLLASRPAFKDYGRRWADDAVKIGTPMLPVRPASMHADHPPGTLRASLRRKSATRYKAVVAAYYTQYFIDAGVKPHSLRPRKGRPKKGTHGRTIFEKASRKVHPGYPARPFRARMAHEALDRNGLADTVIDAWNKAA